jgi:hypothetical protein
VAAGEAQVLLVGAGQGLEQGLVLRDAGVLVLVRAEQPDLLASQAGHGIARCSHRDLVVQMRRHDGQHRAHAAVHAAQQQGHLGAHAVARHIDAAGVQLRLGLHPVQQQAVVAHGVHDHAFIGLAPAPQVQIVHQLQHAVLRVLAMAMAARVQRQHGVALLQRQRADAVGLLPRRRAVVRVLPPANMTTTQGMQADQQREGLGGPRGVTGVAGVEDAALHLAAVEAGEAQGLRVAVLGHGLQLQAAGGRVVGIARLQGLGRELVGLEAEQAPPECAGQGGDTEQTCHDAQSFPSSHR